MDFHICVRGAHPTRVVLFAELDLATAPEVAACLERLEGDVEVVCSDLSFMDAAGLAVFVEAHVRCTGAGATLTLIEPSALVMRVLKVTELDAYLDIRSESAAPR